MVKELFMDPSSGDRANSCGPPEKSVTHSETPSQVMPPGQFDGVGIESTLAPVSGSILKILVSEESPVAHPPGTQKFSPSQVIPLGL